MSDTLDGRYRGQVANEMPMLESIGEGEGEDEGEGEGEDSTNVVRLADNIRGSSYESNGYGNNGHVKRGSRAGESTLDEDDELDEWIEHEMFERLDNADGHSDGRIQRKALVKWLSALDLQRTIDLEENLNVSPYQLERLVSRADDNKDGYVDKAEFRLLLHDYQTELNKQQLSVLRQYMQVVAYAEEYRCWPPPLFVLSMTVAQVALYVYHINHFLTSPEHKVANGSPWPISWSGPDPTCSRLIYDPSRRHEAWRFASYSLVHAGLQHLLFNMIMQILVGVPLEMSHGSLRIGLVYASGVLAGSLATSALDPGVFLAGASGGVYALIAAHLATLILNWREDILIMKHRFRRHKSTSAKHGHIVRLIRLLAVLTYGAVDTGLAVYKRHADVAVKTSYIAHFSGALAGLLIGLVVLKNRKVEHWEQWMKVICVVVFVVLLLLTVIWNIVADRLAHIAWGDEYDFFKKENYSVVYPL